MGREKHSFAFVKYRQGGGDEEDDEDQEQEAKHVVHLMGPGREKRREQMNMNKNTRPHSVY